MIRLTGLEGIPQFLRELDLAFAEMDRQLSANFEAFTKEVHENIVRSTPQWTGDLAVAWNYSIGAPDMSYTPTPNKIEGQQFWSKADVFQRGAAVSQALAKAAGVHPTWRDVVYIHNPAPIAQKVEDWRILIRPVNLVDGQVAMVQYWYERYTREPRIIQ
jgi:hypothetical protein